MLNAELRVNEADGELIDEVVEVTFSDDRVASLQIPVQAIIARSSSSETAAPPGS